MAWLSAITRLASTVMNPKSTIFLIVFGFAIAMIPEAVSAQVLFLPTIRVFRTNTVVSVPDGGTISLGGVNSSRRQGIRRGSGLPGPLFNNRGISRQTNAARSSVSAKVIVMSEYEEAVLAEAKRRRLAAQANDPNGSPAVQAQADFITRNIGRSRKR